MVLWFVLWGCGPGGRQHAGNCPGLCTALGFQECNDGAYAPPVACPAPETCDPTYGCVTCAPDQPYCGDDGAVYQCNHDGTGGTKVMDCPQDQTCSMGACKTPCEAALDHPSNVGCDFWAADLDNEAFSIGIGVSNNAAAAQFAIVAANDNDYPVNVTVTENAARVGDPVSEQTVTAAMVPPHTATRIDLPQREVDGSMGQNASYVQNSGSGTFVSPHAYHVVSDGPVVVYQFNPIVQQYSNDASTLIPIQALGTFYSIIGFNTANPCGLAGQHVDSIPDHTFVTIIPTQDDTTVTVTTTNPIAASGGDSGLPIAQTVAGGTVTLSLSRYTVANLESYQPDNASFSDCISAPSGDFTGTLVHSDKPVVVFTGGERGIGFGGADNVVYPPDWDSSTDDICCTDHLEEQLLPVTALGKEFAIARSPIRSTDPTGWKEPDIVRVLATVDGTHVTTNLPAPYDSFVLGANQQKTFASTVGFAMSADQAIEVSTYLVPQHFVKHGYIGDPSQLLMPAAEQFRKDYVFLIPPTWTSNYAVLAKPTDAMVTLDGMPIATIAGCYSGPIGTVAGSDYDQITCPLPEGHHTVSADKPFGLSVYGWHDVGSYAFVGGSDVKIINPIF
ncbi:MAG: IgGFc-binding protein [Acidobacteriota bacterium]